MEAGKPRVYFIACNFPPFGRGNSITNACVASHLTRYFEVVVICKEREDGLLINYDDDASLVRDLPADLIVHRVPGGKWLGRLNEILYAVGLLPCYYLNWAWSVARRGRELIAKGGVVFAVYPVLSGVVAGWYLSRRHGCPLVLDFRDDFAGVMSRGWRRPLAPVYRWLESGLVRAANRVTVTTEVLKDDLVARHGLDARHVSVVYNIVPKAAGSSRPRNRQEGRRLTIVYAGAISAIQKPEILVIAYRKLLSARPDMIDRIRVELYGPDSHYFRLKVRQHLTGGCTYGGFLPHDELQKRLATADIGFLSLADPTFAYATPTKLFEYAEMGMPLLAILPPGAARKMIESNDIGAVADCGDVDGLAARLEELVDQPELMRRFETNVEQMRDRISPEGEVEKWREAICASAECVK